jgi:hypothetical protein
MEIFATPLDIVPKIIIFYYIYTLKVKLDYLITFDKFPHTIGSHYEELILRLEFIFKYF